VSRPLRILILEDNPAGVLVALPGQSRPSAGRLRRAEAGAPHRRLVGERLERIIREAAEIARTPHVKVMLVDRDADRGRLRLWTAAHSTPRGRAVSLS